ncbi:hypothetical protein PR048_023832 [Dryococelus australis]|uniref:Capsid protein n=1 Tax=Dryococelus australis TaxID=614101 RepID=A0ABQ9GV88_9NEOP|nr:hypothetical protein PR048_023832 [Dryococelus australis]
MPKINKRHHSARTDPLARNTTPTQEETISNMMASGTPSGIGQTGEQTHDGYGYDMYPTVPSNHFTRTQQWDADFSTDQNPIALPYRSLGFWCGTSDLQPYSPCQNYVKQFQSILSYGILLQINSLEFQIHNQAVTRQRLLTQGSTSTTTWDFEGSQNLIIATGDRTATEITILESNCKPPFIRATSLDIMSAYAKQDIMTYEELAKGHTKICTIPHSKALHMMNADYKTRKNSCQHAIPRCTGTSWMQNDNINYSETWHYSTRGEMRRTYNFPVIALVAPEIPAETGTMKFRYRLRVQTKMDYTFITEPFCDAKPWGRDYYLLPARQNQTGRSFKFWYPGFDMHNII